MQVEFTGKQTVHNGKLYKAGEKAQIGDERAKELVKAGVVKEVGKGAAKKEG